MPTQIFLEYSKAEKERLVELCAYGVSMGLPGSELLQKLMNELLKLDNGLMLTSNPADIEMLRNTTKFEVVAQLISVKRNGDEDD